MLAEFFTVIPQTPSLVLVTYRPEYRGSLSRVAGAQTIALAPLSDSETAALVIELLGPDPSVGGLVTMIAEKAAGNPFFAEEMVRDLAERGVLRGNRSAYVSIADAGEVSVPATLQATIAARIDRLDPAAKRTLSAAAVIGTKFSRDMLKTLGIDPVLQDLVSGEFIDQITFTGQPEYVFHHPLIRTVAYESQLKSDRAELHRRVAAAIEARDPAAADENAALIAEHLEAAGDLHAAYGWHMRAATWATNRDIGAARVSWERARQIADALPADDPDRTAMRIAPRTMLCGTAFRAHVTVAGDRFNELRELCTAIGDKASLAIAMAGLVIDHAHQGRMREASQLASEHMALIESLGDPTLTVGLSFAAIYAKMESAEMSDVLRWSQKVIDLADGDPAKGNFIIGSPLAAAFATRAIARYALGRPGWRDDLQQALAMARSADPLSYARVVTYAYLVGIPAGVLRADDRVVREIEDALRMAERSGDDHAVSNAQITLGLALVHRPTDAERDRGQKLLAEVSDVFLRLGYFRGDLLLIVQVYLARERARCGDRDEAIPLMRAAVDHLLREGVGSAAPVVLVETLLDRGTDDDCGRSRCRDRAVGSAPADQRSGDTRHLAAAATRTAGTRSRRRHHLSRLPGSLPRHGENAWLRRTYRVGRGDAMTGAAPSGVVTFLFTDVEGSTRRWEKDADEMRIALAAHDEVLRSATEAHGGFMFKHTGDGVCAAFASPKSALDAAISAQRALELPVRMGIATGEAELRGTDYFGAVLNRAARVMAAGHGGQILVADSTAGLLSGVDLVDLGPRRLRDLPIPVGVFQVRVSVIVAVPTAVLVAPRAQCLVSRITERSTRPGPPDASITESEVVAGAHSSYSNPLTDPMSPVASADPAADDPIRTRSTREYLS